MYVHSNQRHNHRTQLRIKLIFNAKDEVYDTNMASQQTVSFNSGRRKYYIGRLGGIKG